MRVRRLSSFSVKLRNSLLQTYGLQIVLILTPYIIENEVLCRIVYQKPVRGVTNMKQHLTDTWNGLSQSIIDEDATDECWKRLRVCVNEKGRHFEHLL